MVEPRPAVYAERQEPWYRKTPQTGMEIRLISRCRMPQDNLDKFEKVLEEPKRNTLTFTQIKLVLLELQ